MSWFVAFDDSFHWCNLLQKMFQPQTFWFARPNASAFSIYPIIRGFRSSFVLVVPFIFCWIFCYPFRFPFCFINYYWEQNNVLFPLRFNFNYFSECLFAGYRFRFRPNLNPTSSLAKIVIDVVTTLQSALSNASSGQSFSQASTFIESFETR